jgi:hypothetical protein
VEANIEPLRQLQAPPPPSRLAAPLGHPLEVSGSEHNSRPPKLASAERLVPHVCFSTLYILRCRTSSGINLPATAAARDLYISHLISISLPPYSFVFFYVPHRLGIYR